MARWRGAEVIATTSSQNLPLARKLGAQHVIDYAAERFDESVRGVDVVFDTVGGETTDRSFQVLRKGGTLISIAKMVDGDRAAALGLTSVFFIVRPSRPQLQEIASLIDAGHVQVSIEEVYPLARAREAFERSLAGHLRGKVVLRVDH